MSEHSECWLPVPDYEGWYEVSDLGRMRSVDRVVTYRDGRVRRYPGQMLNPVPSANGRNVLNLSRGNGPTMFYVYTLVLTAFVGPKPPGMECCHNNGDPSDDRLSNIRWDTSSANSYDTVRHGRHHQSSKTHCHKDHPFDEANTIRRPGGRRMCRTCKNERQRQLFHERKRAELASG